MERKIMARALGLAVVACGLMGGAGVASADVFNLGGVRDPSTGQWTGTASLETVSVGDAGNTADSTGYGWVDYAYNIGKYEVTAGQYTAFLNAVAATDTHALYNSNMWSNAYGCKIQRTGSSGSYAYTVAADYADRPVNYVSFWDACRFTNWLNNGQGHGDTETGAYNLTSDRVTNNTVIRNAGATWAVTSEDEWYKAAYYKGGGTNAGYWLYPTRSDTAPGQDRADASGNNANYYTAPYAFPIDGTHYTTVVGEFQNSASPCGTFDQGGNVREWNEAIIAGSYRGTQGGSFNIDGNNLQSGYGISYNPSYEIYNFGFRVSQVPEPASLGILGIGVVAMLVGLRGSRR